MKKIPLTKGKYAFVDDADFAFLSQWKWFLGNGCVCRDEGDNRGQKKRQRFYMHREILNAPAGMEVDHKNRDFLDNQRGNLRLANSSQNKMNRKKRSDSGSKFKGVRWLKNRSQWTARIKTKTIGYFNSELYAAMAYDLWAKELFGEFALLNFN